MNKSTTQKILTGAAVVAGAAAAGAALAHEPTRKKIIKKVKTAFHDVEVRTKKAVRQASEQYDKAEKMVDDTKNEDYPSKRQQVHN